MPCLFARSIEVLAVTIIALCFSGCSLSPPTLSTNSRPAELSLLFVGVKDMPSARLSRAASGAMHHLSRQFNLHITWHQIELDYEPGKAHSAETAVSEARRKLEPHLDASYDGIFVALPNKADFFGKYFGYAEGVGAIYGRRNSIAYGVLGEDEKFNQKVMLHELGHLLGADHSLTGLMTYDSTLIRLATGYSPASVAEIQERLRSRRPFSSWAGNSRFTSAALE